MSSKQAFMNKAKIRSLSKKEKERRWKQHQMSKRSDRSEAKRGMTRATRIKTRTTTAGKMTAEIALSPCAQRYLLALQCPFSLKTPACIPDMHAVPSKKIRVKQRFTFSTGTDGFGYVIANPWANAQNTPAGKYSVAGSTFGPNINPAGNTIQQNRLPYLVSQFQVNSSFPGVQARTVGMGLRLRYLGPDLARSGQIVGLRHPDNESIENKNFDQLRAYDTSKTFSNKRQWIYVQYRPVQPQEYEFTPFPDTPKYALENGGSHTPIFNMGMAISGTTTSLGDPGPAPFEAEIIHFIEYLGAIDNVSSTPVDVEGISHVRNSLHNKSTTDNPHRSLTKSLKMIEDNVGESLPAIAGGALLHSKLAGGAEAAEEESILSSALSTAGEGLSTVSDMALPFVEDAALALLPFGI